MCRLCRSPGGFVLAFGRLRVTGLVCLIEPPSGRHDGRGPSFSGRMVIVPIVCHGREGNLRACRGRAARAPDYRAAFSNTETSDSACRFFTFRFAMMSTALVSLP